MYIGWHNPTNYCPLAGLTVICCKYFFAGCGWPLSETKAAFCRPAPWTQREDYHQVRLFVTLLLTCSLVTITLISQCFLESGHIPTHFTFKSALDFPIIVFLSSCLWSRLSTGFLNSLNSRLQFKQWHQDWALDNTLLLKPFPQHNGVHSYTV